MLRTIIIVLGLIVALMPALGFPESFNNGFYVAAGLAIALFAWIGKRRMVAEDQRAMEEELVEFEKENELPVTVIEPVPAAEVAPAETPAAAKEVVHQEENPTPNIAIPLTFEKRRGRNLTKRITHEHTP